MSFVPGYDNDIFIGYAHIDNAPIDEGKSGWVDYFEKMLRKWVMGKSGEEIAIFRDPRLRHFGEFSDQLADQLDKSAVFLCVLSPAYLKSEWCRWELREFCRRASNHRIIKVVKTAVDEQGVPPELTRILDYRFYRKNEFTGQSFDLCPEIIPDHFPDFFEVVESVAQDLVELLKSLRNGKTAAVSQAPISQALNNGPAIKVVTAPNGVAVYLAQTTSDLREERTRIQSELRQFNYRVLPDRDLPSEAEELVRTVRDCLRQAALSIHLIGAKYGIRPEGAEKSLPHIQYDLASEMARARRLKQLAWIPAGLTPVDEAQQRFVDGVKDNAPECLQIKIEDLKTEVLRLLSPDSASAIEDDDETDPVNVYLFYQDQDRDSVKKLYSYLRFKELFNVKRPPAGALTIQSHKQLLQVSDAVLVYYGAGDEDWLENNWRMIQRYSSTSGKPVLVKAIYAGSPLTTEKEMLDSDDPLIIKNYEDFNPSVIQPFIERVRAAKGGKRR